MIISDLAVGVQGLLSGRTNYPNTLAEYTRKSVLELTESYKFPLLQAPGPVVQLQVGVSSYDPSFFMNSGDASLDLNHVDSIWVYLTGYSPVATTNSGYSLTFATVDTLEPLLNIQGVPIHWTRHGGKILIACPPDQMYYSYIRYKKEHPFPNRGLSGAAADPILMPSSWQDVLEYSVALRIARDLNLTSKAAELFTALYGDRQFQNSGGVEGSPGLIFGRVSQESQDQGTTTKRLIPRMRSC